MIPKVVQRASFGACAKGHAYFLSKPNFYSSINKLFIAHGKFLVHGKFYAMIFFNNLQGSFLEKE